jgi:hypothetical protein
MLHTLEWTFPDMAKRFEKVSSKRLPPETRVEDPRPRVTERSSTPWIWWALAVAGILVRVGLWWTSIGTNDIDNWQLHGKNVAENGLTRAYITSVIMNHPPLMALYSALVWSMAGSNLVEFARLLKLPGLFGEAVTLWALWRFAGVREFAVYALLPAAILIGSFHGSTDGLYAAIVLVAAIAFDRKQFLLSGVLWSAALNVKLLPIVLVPMVFISAPDIRAFSRIAVGFAAGMLTFIPPALGAAKAMYRNMLAYNSTPDNWGVLAFLNNAVATPSIAGFFTPIRQWYLGSGRYAILASIVCVALISRYRHRLPMTEQAALAACLFLIFAPGFGVQYVVFPLPLLCLVDLPAAVRWGCLAGIFIAVDYWVFLTSWLPARTWITSNLPGPVPLLGILAWAVLVHFVWVHVVAALKRPVSHGGASANW